MGRNVVVLGDATSHGGNVTSASSSFDISGKNAALLNETVSCPEHGTNKIIECDVSAYEDNGRSIVLHGCKTQCGANIIAGMQDMGAGLWVGLFRRCLIFSVDASATLQTLDSAGNLAMEGME